MAKICVSILEIRPRHPLSFLLCGSEVVISYLDLITAEWIPELATHC
jgi:hypothetical protein